MNIRSVRNPVLAWFSLFTSIGTLVCCALPSLLVLLGLGATVASFLSAAPWLVVLSRHKIWVFSISGALIAVNFMYTYRIASRARNSECLPGTTDVCEMTTGFSRIVLWISAAIYSLGLVTAFLLGPILARLDS